MQATDHSLEAVKSAVIRSPEDAAALAGFMAEPGDDASCRVAAWFHRYLRLIACAGPADALAVRRALQSADVLNHRSIEAIDLPGVLAVPETAGLMAAIQYLIRNDTHPVLAKGYSRRLPLAVRARIAVMENPMPARVSHAYDIMNLRRLGASWLWRCGFLDEARRLNQATTSYLERVRPAVNGDVRYLTDSWTFAIGHIVMLAHLAYAVRHGMTTYGGLKIFQGAVANRPLLDMVDRQVAALDIVPEQECLPESHLSTDLEVFGDRRLSHFEFYEQVLQAHPPDGGALLNAEPSQHALVERLLAACGLPTGRPVVTLHNREAGFRRSLEDGSRDAEIGSFLPAIRLLVARGYTVVRLGDASMTPLPQIDGAFDYAHSPHKSAELDVALIATARFHIGSSSGLSLVAMLFGVPTLFVNWHPIHLLPFGRRNWIVLKGLRDLADARQRIAAADYRRYGSFARAVLADEGLALEDLTAEQIEVAVEGFLRSLETPDNPVGSARLWAASDVGELLELPPDQVRVG
ncbi:MAG: TIGR04372 family glycosyltransferase [Thalassobaculaceae bacterium]|nr:TIGR04372 family glycosyltransferase [Thalassobaculaceae bacterium]